MREVVHLMSNNKILQNQLADLGLGSICSALREILEIESIEQIIQRLIHTMNVA